MDLYPALKGNIDYPVDTREQAPFNFQGYDVALETATLPVGDYSLPGFEDRGWVLPLAGKRLLRIPQDGR